MEKIFQRFDLEEIIEKNEEKRGSIKTRKILFSSLLEKEYTILEGNSSYNSIPKSIIIGGNIGMPIKNDFYTLAKKLGLKFSSREFYTEVSE